MASFSQLYTVLTVPFLASWTALALGFTALDVLNSNRSPIQLIASTSLFTFLVCRLLVVSQSSTFNENSIAHIITTFYQRSARNALVFLLFTFSWLYELLHKSLAMIFVTIFGGALATALYNDAFVEVGENGEPVSMEEDIETSALAEIDHFKETTGVDPTQIFKMIPPKVLIYLVALVWFSFATLGLYVLRLTWRSLRRVFGASPAELTAQPVEKSET
ncbi:hypothetical protein BDV12DRAFT_70761 [Aspergillus spectabilis]